MSNILEAAKKDKRQVNEKICNLEREYRDCIKVEETRLGSQGIS